jgi:alpha-ketoglutarate-dependent taurine dioxygenase
MELATRSLTNHTGSEVRLAPDQLLTPEAGGRLRELLVERGVLAFKQLHLTDEQQLNLTRLLGAVREERGRAIMKISLDPKAQASAEYLRGSFLWHIDGTHDDVPPFATLLTGRRLSIEGGQTEFANAYAAYEALPPETKARIENLKVVHSVEVSMRRAAVEPTEKNLAYWRSLADKTHRLVWTHRSGRKSLVIGCHASHIEGMNLDEGRQLLGELLDWATQPRFVYRHEWSVGDLLVWDNTGVLHRVTPYAEDSGREMHRTTLHGEEPFN